MALLGEYREQALEINQPMINANCLVTYLGSNLATYPAAFPSVASHFVFGFDLVSLRHAHARAEL